MILATSTGNVRAQDSCVTNNPPELNAFALRPGDVACGLNALATGGGSNLGLTGATAYGGQANARGTNTTAIGNFSGFGALETVGATSIGSGANRNALPGIFSTAIGGGTISGTVQGAPSTSPQSTGAYSIAIGGGDGIVGNGAVSSGERSIAIGLNSTAGFVNSTAFGNGATVIRANQQVFGTTTNTYTMTGIASAESQAAQSGALQLVTTDGGGNLAGRTAASLGLASSTDIAGINSQTLEIINSEIGAINARLNDVDDRTRKATNGVAMAFALSGVPWLQQNERFAVSANWGTFQGTNGLGVNAALRLGTNVQADGGVAFGTNGGGVGGRAGLRFGW